ncbi:MAG: hypothetical protein AABX01_07655 [Candidatus Micrarchaeota archaeon]
MATVSVSVPDDLKRRMDGMKYMNWSGVAREAFEEKVSTLERLYKITDKSKLTEENAIEMGRKLNKKIAMRHEEALRRMKKDEAGS